MKGCGSKKYAGGGAVTTGRPASFGAPGRPASFGAPGRPASFGAPGRPASMSAQEGGRPFKKGGMVKAKGGMVSKVKPKGDGCCGGKGNKSCKVC